MNSIDDLLSQVAKITSTAPTEITDKKPTYKEKIVPIKVSRLTLDLAKEVISCVQKGARELGKNVAVAITNDNGRLIAFEAMDDTILAATDIAQRKAYTSAALRMTTADALEKSRGGDLDGLTNGDGLLLLGGGAPLMAGDMLMGAVGDSGATKDEDTMFADLGARAYSEKIKKING